MQCGVRGVCLLFDVDEMSSTLTYSKGGFLLPKKINRFLVQPLPARGMLLLPRSIALSFAGAEHAICALFEQ